MRPLLLLVSLLACSPQETAPAPAPGAKWEHLGPGIARFTDETTGVVCYGAGVAMSCVRYAPMPWPSLGTEPDVAKVRR